MFAFDSVFLRAVCIFLRIWKPATKKYDVTGEKKELKATQAYPAGYGRATVKL